MALCFIKSLQRLKRNLESHSDFRIIIIDDIENNSYLPDVQFSPVSESYFSVNKINGMVYLHCQDSQGLGVQQYFGKLNDLTSRKAYKIPMKELKYFFAIHLTL